MENEVMANEFIVKRGLIVVGDTTISGSVNGRDIASDGTRLDHLSVTQAVNLDTLESDTVINNAKVGITPTQASNITTNNAKVTNVVHPLVETAVPSGAVFTDTNTVYTHPTTAGNKHMPTGGAVGQAVINTASGTGTWQDVSTGGYTEATTAPTSPETGDLWYDTATEILYQYLTDSWIQISDDGAVASAEFQAAEIKTAYESNANTNEFSDAEQTKLLGIEASATADQTSVIGSSGSCTGNAATASQLTEAGAKQIHIHRNNSATSGIGWYSNGYSSWVDYMSSVNVANCGPGVAFTSPAASTLVTSWAKRSFIEGAGGYGWTFESGSAQGNPAVVAQIRSSDGSARFNGNLTAGNQPHWRGSLTNTNGAGFANAATTYSTRGGLTFASSKVTIAVAGVYSIHFNSISDTGLGRVDSAIRINGTNIVSMLNETSGNGYHYKSGAIDMFLNVNDYVQFSNNDWYAGSNSNVSWKTASVTLLN